ncbi:hypothetical protein TNCT_549241 [Trichonephila clavata]|uniref:Uncharacterized protein n=1 Tax=Trichonephila clavata TaxID=2740835 RepID=A0A8X6F4T9_TRICU|nr:hypothetical protein TNCT_549241 [Trichonephila clavata]
MFLETCRTTLRLPRESLTVCSAKHLYDLNNAQEAAPPTIPHESSSLQSSWRASPNACALRVDLCTCDRLLRSAMPYPRDDFLSGFSALFSTLKLFLDPLAGRRDSLYDGHSPSEAPEPRHALLC